MKTEQSISTIKQIQHAIITDEAIFGIGDTPQAAKDDAKEWMDDDTDLSRYLISGEMKLVQITDELAQKVLLYGGDIDFEVTYGLAHSTGLFQA